MQRVLVSVSAVVYTRIIVSDRIGSHPYHPFSICKKYKSICKKVSEIPPCVLQQTLFTNNGPHVAGLPDADKK